LLTRILVRDDMIKIFKCFGCLLFFCPLLGSAQLTITVSPPKIIGQKSLVKLAMKNGFASEVESARAVCFLLDGQGKMIGQSTKWVIGQNHIGLEPQAETTFSFLITNPQSFGTTNLTAKVLFSRVTLEGGEPVDVRQSVSVTASAK